MARQALRLGIVTFLLLTGGTGVQADKLNVPPIILMSSESGGEEMPPPEYLPAVPAEVPLAPQPHRAPITPIAPIPVPAPTESVLPPEVIVDTLPLPGRVWVSAEVLQWFPRNDKLPPLVNATVTVMQGLQSSIQDKTFFGAGGVNGQVRPGTRITVGLRLDPGRGDTLEANVFSLEPGRQTFDLNELAPLMVQPPATRPFLNAQTGQPDSLPVNNTTFLGTVNAAALSDFLGAEVNYRTPVVEGACFRLGWLGGYRFLRLNESLRVTSGGTVLSDPVYATGTFLQVEDQFATDNSFHGLQTGFDFGYYGRQGSIVLTTKVAVGRGERDASIAGATTVNNAISVGGLLAQVTNIGSASSSDIDVVPELALNCSWQATRRARVWVGYTLLYWNTVTRPGGLIDITVNPTLVPSFNATGQPVSGPLRPTSNLGSAGDFTVQGVQVGFEYRFGGP